MIATEAAIALKVALQADRTGAPAVGAEAAEKAIRAKEDQLAGRPLTDGQKAMIRSVATSGPPVELIVGVAGAGKTTAVDAARQAFEDAGYRVVGTSTSGQAARPSAPKPASTNPAPSPPSFGGSTTDKPSWTAAPWLSVTKPA